jgi:cytidyltransferase-like protein
MKKQSKIRKSGIKRIAFLQGAFDIINWGHIKAFKKAKSYGDYLIVALNSDELLREYKGREPVLPYWQKKFIIESCKYVDKVIKASEFSPLRLLKRYDVDVYCATREWQSTKKAEMEYIKSKGGETKFLPRFKGVIATSKIKQILLKEAQEGFKN